MAVAQTLHFATLAHVHLDPPQPTVMCLHCTALADALSYLTTRLQSEFKVEVGSIQPQRRAVAALIKPLGGQASKQQ